MTLLTSFFRKYLLRFLVSLAASATFSGVLWLSLPVFLKAGIAILLVGGSGFAVVRLLPKSRPWKRSLLGTGALSLLVGWLGIAGMLLLLIIALPSKATLTPSTANALLGTLFTALTTASITWKPFKKTVLIKPVVNWPLTASLFIGVIALSAPYLINPLAQDNDNFLTAAVRYFDGALIQLSDLRPIFSGTYALFAHTSGLHLTFMYPLVAPILFFLGVLVWLDYLSDQKQAHLRPLVLLGLVALPLLFIELYITRPQVVLLAFTLPLFCLAQYAFQKKSTVSTAVGLGVSVLLLTIHELAIVYLALFGGLLLWLTYYRMHIEKTWKTRSLFLAILIVLPYFLLLPFGSFLDQVLDMGQHAVTAGVHWGWEWWFIDSYESVDGTNLGWPGLQAAHYYLYNGLLCYLALIFLFILGRKFTWKNHLPILLFLGFFLFFAEIAPRFGLTFLLNRTWPYIALASIFLLPPILGTLTAKHRAISIWLLGAAAAAGLAGVWLVSRDNVVLFFPEEKAGAAFIRDHLPSDSIILSRQNNKTLAFLFAGRQFAQVTPDIPTTLALNEAVHAQLNNLNSPDTRISVQQSDETVTRREVRGDFTITSTAQTITERAATTYNPQEVYFLYSKRKATGKSAERLSQYNTTLDKQNEEPQDLRSYPIIYEDDAIIVVAIR